MVLTANGGCLVQGNTTLGLSSSGDLVLKDVDSTLVWSTNTFTNDFQGMLMEDSGNLVLLNSSNGTMWESFDHPTDTLVSATTPPQIPHLKCILGSLYLKISYDGHMKFYSLQTNIGIYDLEFLSVVNPLLRRCDYPTICGQYGMCTANGCNFPGKDKYFFQIDPSNPSSGCRPYNPVVCSRTPTGSSRTPHHSFLELEQVSYLSYMWENAFIVELVKGDYYRNLFSTNCSCKEAFIGYDVKSISTHGYCYLKSSVFPLQKNNKTSGFYYNSIVYIKVQSRPKPPNYSVIIITVSVAGAAATLFLLLWAWIYKLANGRAEEQKDGDLDFPTGSPVRYSFEDLQKATNDFNMRLGSGGFSSVYEGVLLDNTKIVVKQLDRIFPNESHQHVLDWKAEEGGFVDLVDSEIKDEGIGAEQEAAKVLGIVLCCIQYDFTRRPAMSSIVKALEDMSEMDQGAPVLLV
ncbi:hypothetical protein SUGI_0721410 [Cryptomeria japonica]|nr:hypothetical protein SUGI_0721410 [Cryptomeria japonica]